jgi:hypothetical protein
MNKMDLEAIKNELIKREPIFHHPEFVTSRDDFEKMTTEDFFEVGASGNIYERQYVIDTLVERHSKPHQDIWETKDFVCRQIAPDSFLFTYTLIQDSKRVSRRSTIWQRADNDWKIFYHQGTLVTE